MKLSETLGTSEVNENRMTNLQKKRESPRTNSTTCSDLAGFGFNDKV